jgi:hypothetical protein
LIVYFLGLLPLRSIDSSFTSYLLSGTDNFWGFESSDTHSYSYFSLCMHVLDIGLAVVSNIPLSYDLLATRTVTAEYKSCGVRNPDIVDWLQHGLLEHPTASKSKYRASCLHGKVLMHRLRSSATGPKY